MEVIKAIMKEKYIGYTSRNYNDHSKAFWTCHCQTYGLPNIGFLI